MAVGTIIPWTGPLGGDYGVPPGWLICRSQFLEQSEYPELFEIIGNRYGGAPGSGVFSLPDLPSKNLCDYHPSHQASQQFSSNFSQLLGTNSDVANSNVSFQTSNIDLRVTLSPIAGNLRATVEGMNLTNSTYVTTYGYVERRLGDLHWGTHSHGGEYRSTSTTNLKLEACQTACGTNCAAVTVFGVCIPSGCQDECSQGPLYRGSPDGGTTQDFCIPSFDGGQTLGAGRQPYGTNDYKMARTPPTRNFIDLADDCVLGNIVGASGGYEGETFDGIYGTNTSSDIVNFTNPTMAGHFHSTQALSITRGNVATRESVRINTISTESITPVNSDVQDVMSITANVDTPVLVVVYIIKAY